MKFMRQLCASLVLVLVLALSAFADGDTIHTGYKPLSAPVTQTDTSDSDGASGTEANTVDSLEQVLLSIVESTLSVL